MSAKQCSPAHSFSTCRLAGACPYVAPNSVGYHRSPPRGWQPVSVHAVSMIKFSHVQQARRDGNATASCCTARDTAGAEATASALRKRGHSSCRAQHPARSTHSTSHKENCTKSLTVEQSTKTTYARTLQHTDNISIHNQDKSHKATQEAHKVARTNKKTQAHRSPSQSAQEADPGSQGASLPRPLPAHNKQVDIHNDTSRQQRNEQGKRKQTRDARHPQNVVTHQPLPPPPPAPPRNHPRQPMRVTGKSPCLHTQGMAAPSCPFAHTARTAQRRPGSQPSPPRRGKMHTASGPYRHTARTDGACRRCPWMRGATLPAATPVRSQSHPRSAAGTRQSPWPPRPPAGRGHPAPRQRPPAAPQRPEAGPAG